MPTTTLVSWNLKGSAGPDLSAITGHLRAENADVVVLQEVQRHQARAISRALDARSWHWGFKHWPLRTWPEGMAVIGVTRPAEVRTLALSQRWRMWSWRRRIVQVATVAGPADRLPDGDGGDREAGNGDVGGGDAGGGDATGSGDALMLINVHLSPHRQTELRATETATVLALVGERAGPVVVCGDLNERPGGAVHRQMASAGLRDGWAEGDAHGTDAAGEADPWPTNWRGWRPGTTKLPTQQLDYVYASGAIPSLAVRTPVPGGDGFERFATLSDHLPVTAELELP